MRHDDDEPRPPRDAPPAERAPRERAPVEGTPREGAPAEPLPGERAPAGTPEARPRKAPRPTLAGRVWVGLAIGAVLLILLIVFLAENEHQVEIEFLGVSIRFPLGLALLVAAVFGSVVTLLAGGTRIVQLRREVRRQRRR